MLVTLLAALASAHPGGHEGDYPPPRPAAPAPATTPIPATYPEVVEALRARATAIETAIDAFKIADVHREAAAASDLAAALAAKSSTFSAESKAKVTSAAEHLKAQWTELVARADKGDMVAAKAALSGARTDLDTLASLKN